MKKIINLIMKKKKIIALISTTVFLGLFFVIPEVRAADMDWPTKVIGGILGALIGAVGLLLILVIKALVYVASYSNFINSGAVTYGWIMVRDLCNMFFVVVLLIIAFGTILNIESYNYKKWLPKLIMMAILINFSKTICGLLIDVAQVVMLTFVNSFKDIGGANMTTVLGIDTILKLDKESPDAGFWQIVGAYMLGLIYIIIALIVITTMMVMLVMRIVMIWIYVVLSPLAYLMAAFPGGQSYSSKWWKDFTSNLIVGPVLAFFIWLSLAALNADQISAEEQQALEEAAQAELDTNVATTSDTAVMMTESSTPGALIKFVIAIGMLLGGLKIAQEVGGAAGAIAGKGMNAVNKAKNMGIAGVAGVTGYTYAKNVAQNYGAMRKAKKQASYQLGAEKLAGGIGAAKKAVGTNVNQALNWSKSKVGLNRAGDRANALNTEAQNKRQQIADMQTNLNRKDGKIGKWEYNKNSKEWQNTSNGRSMSHDDMTKLVSRRSEGLKNEANIASEAAAVQMKKQERTDKWVKAGLITAGVGVGLLTGGAGFAAPITGAAMLGGGIAGAYSGKKKLATMGDYDLAKGSSWRDNKVKSDMEGMKDDNDDEVIAKMDDPSLDKLGRAAAAMEAMSRGLLSSQEAQKRKQQIKNEIGTDKDGNIKDRKLANRFETIAQSKNVSATKRFEDLKNDKNPEKQKKAREAILKDIENGRVSLESLDSGAIEQMGGSLASFMKPKEFAKQFNAMTSPGKKDDLIKAMRKEADVDTSTFDVSTDAGRIAKDNAEVQKIEAMKKIARIENINSAIGLSGNATPTPAQQEYREKTLRSFTSSELTEVLANDDGKNMQAIVDTFVASGKNMASFDKAVQDFLNGSSPTARPIRDRLGIPHPVNKRNQNANQATPAPGSAPAGWGQTSGGIFTPPPGMGGARPNITQNLNNPQPGNNTPGAGSGGGVNIT